MTEDPYRHVEDLLRLVAWTRQRLRERAPALGESLFPAGLPCHAEEEAHRALCEARGIEPMPFRFGATPGLVLLTDREIDGLAEMVRILRDEIGAPSVFHTKALADVIEATLVEPDGVAASAAIDAAAVLINGEGTSWTPEDEEVR